MVVAAGGLGGILSWIYSLSVGEPLSLSLVPAFLSAIVLGMGAAFIGVYVLANSDTQTLMRTLGFALLCGFCWKPVFDAGKALVYTRIEESSVREAAEGLDEDLEALTDATGTELTLGIAAVEGATSDLIRSAGAVMDPRLRAEIRNLTSRSVAALGEVASQQPEAVATALGSIGTAAIESSRPDVSLMATRSLSSIPERSEFRPSVYAESSNSLERMADAAQRTGRSSEQRELSVISREVIDRGRELAGDDSAAQTELQERSRLLREPPRPERREPPRE